MLLNDKIRAKKERRRNLRITKALYKMLRLWFSPQNKDSEIKRQVLHQNMERQSKDGASETKCAYGCKNGKIVGLFPVWAAHVPKKDRKPYIVIDCPDCVGY